MYEVKIDFQYDSTRPCTWEKFGRSLRSRRVMLAVVPTLALTITTAILPRAGNVLTSVCGSFLLIICISGALIFWACTSCSRAYTRTHPCTNDRDNSRDCSTHRYALGYCEHTSGCDVTNTSLYTGCYRT
jgi:hypothetical protein